MSGLARLLLDRGKSVTGSDQYKSPLVEDLLRRGAAICTQHHSSNISTHSKVIYSTAVSEENPEIQAARDLGCPLLHRSDLLAELMEGYQALTVAGTHGKTSTSALLSWVLLQADKDPSFAIGGLLLSGEGNARHGKGPHFVAEADESDGSFSKYNSYGAIVTNLEEEHMDHFGSFSELKKVFQKYFDRCENKEFCFWCGDDPGLQELNPQGISYGFQENCEVRLSQFQQEAWSLSYHLEFRGREIQVQVPMVGQHNALNSAAVVALCLQLGIPEKAILQGLNTFPGLARRTQKYGPVRSVLLIDDYAHHPTEIAATLSSVRKAVGERRLLAIFQPHRFSRTKNVLEQLPVVFEKADRVIVTDIYGAGEEPIAGMDGNMVLEKICTRVPRSQAQYIPRSELVSSLLDIIEPHDVLIAMGAGDITHIHQELMQELEAELPDRLKVGVLFGGSSMEHDISIVSARTILQAIDEELYDVVQFGITRSGEWLTGPDLTEFLSMHEQLTEDLTPGPSMTPEVLHQLCECDVLIPVFHGPYGEDGTIQGFLEVLGKPYVGCDYRSASVCTDKVYAKQIMLSQGIPTKPFICVQAQEWEKSPQSVCQQIAGDLNLPVVVKPVHGGSSIGVCKVQFLKDLSQAIENAMAVDTHIMVEEAIEGRELEFAVVGNEQILVPPPGEVYSQGVIYSYGAKYQQGGIPVEVIAGLPPDKIREGQELAAAAYRTAGCSGFAGVDFFLDHQGDFWFVEINPVPGFTPTSLFAKIWEKKGVDTRMLIDQLIVLALQRKRWLDRVFGRAANRRQVVDDEIN